MNPLMQQAQLKEKYVTWEKLSTPVEVENARLAFIARYKVEPVEIIHDGWTTKLGPVPHEVEPL